MEKKPNQLKVSLGHRREIIEKIAEAEKRSLSETICLLLDLILDKSEEIAELAEVQKRTFLDMASLLVSELEGGNESVKFLRAIASKEKVSDATCIKVARALDVEPESIIHLRNCIRDKQRNGK